MFLDFLRVYIRIRNLKILLMSGQHNNRISQRRNHQFKWQGVVLGERNTGNARKSPDSYQLRTSLCTTNCYEQRWYLASPQASVVSQPEPQNSGCLDHTSDVFQSSIYLTLKGKSTQHKFNQIKKTVWQRLQLSIRVFWWKTVNIRQLRVHAV